jgi:hypothetical protein
MESDKENTEGINVYHTPSLRSIDFDQTDVQDKIDELNLITETDKILVQENKELSAKVSLDLTNVVEETNIKEGEVEEVYKCETHKSSGLEVVNEDPYLKPYENIINDRINSMKDLIKEIEKNEGDLVEFCRSYRKMGLHTTDEGIIFREYAPGAQQMTIVIFYFN